MHAASAGGGRCKTKLQQRPGWLAGTVSAAAAAAAAPDPCSGGVEGAGMSEPHDNDIVIMGTSAADRDSDPQWRPWPAGCLRPRRVPCMSARVIPTVLLVFVFTLAQAQAAAAATGTWAEVWPLPQHWVCGGPSPEADAPPLLAAAVSVTLSGPGGSTDIATAAVVRYRPLLRAALGC